MLPAEPGAHADISEEPCRPHFYRHRTGWPTQKLEHPADHCEFVRAYRDERNHSLCILGSGCGRSERPGRALHPDRPGAFETFVAGLQGGYRDLGLDYDPLRDRFLLWGGGNQVWELDDPNGAVSASGWTIKLDTLAGAGPGAQDASGGVLGKWHYAEKLDAYIALRDINGGEVWVYKPTGWVNPVPEPSTYVMMLAGLLMVISAIRHRQRRVVRLAFA